MTTEDETRQTFLKYLKRLESKDAVFTYAEFDSFVYILQEEATVRGLSDNIFNRLANVIINTDLGAIKKVLLIKCLIPRYKAPEKMVKSMITWCLSSVNELPITVTTVVIQWIIGLWDYELVDRKVINIYYNLLFHVMLKKEKLERHIARLIYVLTKPEDVSRRGVSRLLVLQKNYSKPPTHIIALLSLFKSYKPELVPEKIQSVNIESVWRPIPETIRLALEDARDRAEIQQSRQNAEVYFNWSIAQAPKKKKMLLPSVGYFHIGSSIFKDKNAKSMFDINNLEELGKYQQSIELPCNSVSLLVNTAGYHLLTYANFQYQSRFSYNLYNMLTRAFILENGKFSEEDMDKILSMTIEFSRYMQEGVLVVKLFFDEYLYYNTGDYLPKLFNLLQWMTSISITELRENILVHVQNIFYESNLTMKCEIIRSLQKLITNLFVRQGFEGEWQNTSSSFLRQGPLENLEDIVPVLTTVSESLIVCGLNIHNYNIVLLSESLAFYEEICTLENRSHIPSWSLPPSAVVYGAFVTKSCAILSRICRLLLRYCEMSSRFRQIMPSDVYKEKIHLIYIYAYDIHKALWNDKPFSARKDGKFLKRLSKRVIDDLGDCDLDILLNINNHYAIMPYKYTLIKMGLNINTKEDTIAMAQYYCPAISEFLAACNDITSTPQ